MKSNIIYNKKIAKKFHDVRYYISQEDDIMNLQYREDEKKRLKTIKKQDVTDKIKIAIKSRYNTLEKVPIILQKIYEKNQKYAFRENSIEPINSDIFSLLHSTTLLLIAYKKIRKNKGAVSDTSDKSDDEYKKLDADQKNYINRTLNAPDGIDMEIIQTTSKLIKENKYPWGTSKRIYIEKPGQPDKLRPITLPPFMDKVVQEVIRMILESIYEPYFEKDNCSFGFRSNKGVHHAIYLLSKGQGLHMAIEGDIKSAYDKVNRNILINILGKKIKDRKFLNFIRNRLNYEYYDSLSNKYVKDKEGLPQGGIDSPYLWNIYMKEFDTFILKDIKSFLKNLNKKTRNENLAESKRLIPTPIRRRITRLRTTILKIIKWINFNNKDNNLLTKLKEIYATPIKYIPLKDKSFKFLTGELIGIKDILKDCKIKECISIFEFKKSLLNKRSELNKQFHKFPSSDTNRLRLKYVRYADDWMILTNAKQEIIEIIKDKCDKFLKEELEATLSLEKTLITDIRYNPARFLGFEIRTYRNKLIGKYESKGKIIQAKIAGDKILILPDRQRLINRLHMKGYCNKRGFPIHIPQLINLESFSIIERFNAVLSGLINYYAEFIRYPRYYLQRWIYIITFSCLKTLANKYKASISKIIKKYGTRNIYGEVTIKVIVQNKINNDIYQKAWILKTKKELIENALNLNQFGKIKTVFDQLENNIPVIYNDKDKYNISNDNFLDKINWIRARTKASLDMPCSICGATDNIEMHHIKHVRKNSYKKIRNAYTWEQIMSLRNRKQIPVCKDCHMNIIHAGKYGGQKLNYFAPIIMYDNRIINIESFISKSKDPLSYQKSFEEKGWKKISQDKG